MKTSRWLGALRHAIAQGTGIQLIGLVGACLLILQSQSPAQIIGTDPGTVYPGPTNPPTIPPIAIVTVRAVDPYASEPCVLTVVDEGKFVISRSTYTNLDFTVYFRLSGTASNGVDYSIPSASDHSVVIPKGKWSVELPVRALMDSLSEGVETVILRLQPIYCIAVYPPPPQCYRIGQPSEAVVYIRDCPPEPGAEYVRIFKPLDGQVFPAPANIPIVARAADPAGYFWRAEFFANGQSIHTCTVAYYVAPTNGTPFEATYIWTNVPEGRYALTVQATTDKQAVRTSAPVTVVVGPRPLDQTPVSVVAADPRAIEGTNCWGWWTLTNRYPEGAIEYPANVVGWTWPIWWYTNCGPKNATFTIRRGGDTNQDLRVFMKISGSAVNGMDYESLPDSVVIPAGARKLDLLVVPKSDEVIEPPETVVVELIPPPYMNPLPPPYRPVWPVRAGAVIVDSARPWLKPALLSDRCFYLGVPALDGSWYRVLRSTNFANWKTVCTNQVVQGTLSFVDPEADSANTGFYQAVPSDTPAE